MQCAIGTQTVVKAAFYSDWTSQVQWEWSVSFALWRIGENPIHGDGAGWHDGIKVQRVCREEVSGMLEPRQISWNGEIVHPMDRLGLDCWGS
jgi:hypothetical protein